MQLWASLAAFHSPLVTMQAFFAEEKCYAAWHLWLVDSI